MRVSVCIPTVNRIGYLREAIASVAGQTFRKFEIVVSDNSGDAEYAQRITEVALTFPGISIRVLRPSRKLTSAENANYLVDCARGPYWMYLPDDDRMRPECLASLVGALDGCPRAGFAFSDHWILRSDGAVDAQATEANSRHFRRSELGAGLIPHHRLFRLALHQCFALQATLFRREVIQTFRFDPAREAVPDFDLQLRIASSRHPINAYYCAMRLIEYRTHQDQATAAGDYAQIHQSIIASLERCGCIRPEDLPVYRRKLAASYLALSISEAVVRRRAAALRHWQRALLLNPTNARIYQCALLLALPQNTLEWLREIRRRQREKNARL